MSTFREEKGMWLQDSGPGAAGEDRSLGPQNPNRERVKKIVSLSPGIHLRMLQKLLGASFSTTRYHVEGLRRDGEIVCSKEGRYQRLYPAGTTDGSKATYAVLQGKTARK